MAKTTQIETLRRLLLDERRKLVETAAEGGGLPPSGLLTYLADLDAAALAVEAVLEERAHLATAVVVEPRPIDAARHGTPDRLKKVASRVAGGAYKKRADAAG